MCGKNCEMAYAPASFISGVRKHFGLPASRHVHGKKVTGKQKTHTDSLHSLPSP